jgi:multidrug resistance efflux pump
MTKGRQLVGYHLQKRVLNLKPTAPPDHGRAGWLVTYAIASSIYRWTVVFGIISLLYYFFGQFGLAPFGIMLAVVYVVLTVLWPMFKTMGFVWKQRWDVGKRLVYMGGAAAAAAGVLAVVALLPWKHTIREPLVVLSVSDEPVFVRTPGYVRTVMKDAGDAVRKGEVIMTLSDPSLENLLEQATSQREAEALKANDALSRNQPGVLAASQDALNAYQNRIDAIRGRMENLTLRAPVDGVVVRETSLKSIVGNLVTPGVTVCRVIRTDKLQARISLPQAQAALVKAGMPVKVRLWANPNTPIRSYVARVSSTISDQLLHPALGSEVKGDVDVKADEKGQMKSTNRRSTVFVDLPDNAGFLADGMTGRGEIVVERGTNVAQRVWRAILDSTTPELRL